MKISKTSKGVKTKKYKIDTLKYNKTLKSYIIDKNCSCIF